MINCSEKPAGNDVAGNDASSHVCFHSAVNPY